MSYNPAISVIIPVYNTGKVLQETIDSVLQQTFTNFELILIDDGSSDPATDTIITSQCDHRIRVIRQPNAGVAAARNRGCAEAKGKYISFLDHDDLFLPEKLQETKDLLDNNPSAVIAYSDIIPFGECAGAMIKLAPSDHIDAAVLLRQNRIYSMSCATIRRDVMEKFNITLDPACVPCDDWELYLQCACHGKILHNEKPLVKYRIYGGNQSTNMMKMYRAGIRVIHKNLQKLNKIAAETGISRRELRKAAYYSLSEHHYGIVFQYMQGKCSFWCALANAVKAFFYCPFSSKIPVFIWKKIKHYKN